MFRSIRTMVIVALAGVGLLVGSTAATGAGASISPSLQGGASPYHASWDLDWSGNAPYDVAFYYGDGGVADHSGWSTSASESRWFGSCYDKNFYQSLAVSDALDEVAYASSRVNVQAGACLAG